MCCSYCRIKYQVYGLVGYDTFWLGTKFLEENSTSFFIVKNTKQKIFQSFSLVSYGTCHVVTNDTAAQLFVFLSYFILK